MQPLQTFDAGPPETRHFDNFFLLSGHYEADIDIPKCRLLRWLQQPSSHQKIASGDMKTGEKNPSELEKVLKRLSVESMEYLFLYQF